MADPNGFHIDISTTDKIDRDMTIIRMNVNDFDEAYELLTSKGFTNLPGQIFETSFSKNAMLVSPSGFAIDVIYHKKKPN